MALDYRKRTLRADGTSTGSYTAPALSTGVWTQNLEITALTPDTVPFELDRSVLGAVQQVLVTTAAEINFSTPWSSHGTSTVGTTPNVAELYKTCGMIEGTIAAAATAWATATAYKVGDYRNKSSKSYRCIQAHTSSATNAPDVTGGSAYWIEVVLAKYYQTGDVSEYLSAIANCDGQEFQLRSMRGNVSFDLTAGQLPQQTWTFNGFSGTRSTTAAGSITYSGNSVPLPVNNVNTTSVSLHGQAVNLLSMTMDLNNQVEVFDNPGVTDVSIVNRDVNGTLRIEMPTISTKDWWTAANNLTQGALKIVHGGETTVGKGLIIEAPYVSISSISPISEDRGRAVLELSVVCNPGTTGNDDFKVTYV